jgi:hypothetical protein
LAQHLDDGINSYQRRPDFSPFLLNVRESMYFAVMETCWSTFVTNPKLKT